MPHDASNGPHPTTGHAPRAGAPIIGPAKWFAAGLLFAGSAAALAILLITRSPREIAPLLATTVVTTPGVQPDVQPDAAPQPTPPSTPAPAQIVAVPQEHHPLSPTMTALLVPSVTTASTPPPNPSIVPAPTTPPPKPATHPKTQPKSPLPITPPKAEPKIEPTPPPSTPAISGGTININTATSAELELLPQIGPALAARIIAYRTAHGPFKALADLDKVKGIGPKTLAQLKGLIRFE